MDWYSRTEALLGAGAVERLAAARVVLFGVGGVGSYAAEALGRAGVGHITLVDGDAVSESNLNRQLVALHSTIGMDKAEMMRARLLDINPAADVTALKLFYTAETAERIDLSAFDYAADAIDMVASKLLLAERCRAAGTRLISAMGAGGKLDPTAFQVCDISKTSGCPLARAMRKGLRARGIDKLTVVFSPEEARTTELTENGRHVVGSVSFVPSAAGLVMAGKIVRDLAADPQ